MKERLPIMVNVSIFVNGFFVGNEAIKTTEIANIENNGFVVRINK